LWLCLLSRSSSTPISRAPDSLTIITTHTF
jgi:hypothetical protein